MVNCTQVFVIIMIVILVLFYLSNMYEKFGSFDIPMTLTTDMDWKGSRVSTYPNYPNNLINPSTSVNSQLQFLQNYQSAQDGPTATNWVANGMKRQSDINNVNNLEGFTMMNPYIA